MDNSLDMKRIRLYSILIIFFFLFIRVEGAHGNILNIDEANSVVIGNSILDGKVPYKDDIDPRGPITHYFYALIFYFFGKNNMLAVHYCLIALIAFEALLIFMLGKRCFNSAAGLFAAAFFAVFSWTNPPYDMGAFHTEWCVILFSTLAAMCFIKAMGSHPLYFLLSGIFFGISFLSKQVGAFDFLSALAFLVIMFVFNDRNIKGIVMKLSLMSAGFILPFCLFVVYMISRNALQDFLFWFWQYETKYYLPAVSLAERILRAPKFLFTFFEGKLIYLAFFGSGLVIAFNCFKFIKKNNAENQYFIYFSLWSLASMVACCLSGRDFLHYCIQFLPPVSLLAGASLEKFFNKIGQTLDKNNPVLKKGQYSTIGVLLFCGVLLPFVRTYLDYQYFVFDEGLLRPASAYILQNSSPTDKIFVWGFANQFYVESQRMPASRFMDCSPLTGLLPWANVAPQVNTDYAIVPGTWEILIQELNKNKPKFIVDTSPTNFSYFKKYPISRYPALAKIIREHYIVDPHFVGNHMKDPVIIYVRVAGRK